MILQKLFLIEKLFTILSKNYYRKILIKYLVAASIEHKNILKNLQNSQLKTIIDIGANRGQFSILSREYFPDAKIIAFEPLLEPSEIYHRIFSSDPLTTLFTYAIGSKNELTTIHISNADDSSSLFPISSLQSNLYKGTFEKEIATVQVKPLDTVLNPLDIIQPAFLKIDVQGYEKEVLLGCSSLLNLFQFVYVECSFVELYEGQSLTHEVIELLGQAGFMLSGVYNMSYDKKGMAIQGDFLFTNKKITKI